MRRFRGPFAGTQAVRRGPTGRKRQKKTSEDNVNASDAQDDIINTAIPRGRRPCGKGKDGEHDGDAQKRARLLGGDTMKMAKILLATALAVFLMNGQMALAQTDP